MSIIGIENAIMGTAMQHIGNKFFDAREKNKRFDTWMEYLRIDIDINKCVNSFEQIISQETWPKFNELVNYFGLIAPIAILILVNNFYENQLKYFVYMSWFFITISILIFAILPYRIDKINQTNILVKARKIEIWIHTTRFFIFNSISITILLWILQLQPNQTPSGVEIVKETINILVVVLIGSMVFMEIIHRNFLDKVKTLLNAQHMADYPFIDITTKEADFAGKIQDVFNKNLLILDDNGRKTIVEWNEITTMKLKEASLIDNSPPPSSQENP